MSRVNVSIFCCCFRAPSNLLSTFLKGLLGGPNRHIIRQLVLNDVPFLLIATNKGKDQSDTAKGMSEDILFLFFLSFNFVAFTIWGKGLRLLKVATGSSGALALFHDSYLPSSACS